jgi:hypothetical protein
LWDCLFQPPNFAKPLQSLASLQLRPVEKQQKNSDRTANISGFISDLSATISGAFSDVSATNSAKKASTGDANLGHSIRILFLYQ